MSVRPDFRPEPDEPAVQHPKLRAFVDAARDQPPPEVRVEPEALHAAWVQARRRSRWRAGAGLVAVAAVAVLALVGPRMLDGGAHQPAADGNELAVVTPSEGPPSPTATPPAEPEVSPSPSPSPEASPRLAMGIEVSALGDSDQGAEILGPHRLRLPEGHWSVDSRVPQTVEIVLPGESLELRGGHIHVVVAGDVARVDVLREQVVRIEAPEHTSAEPSQADSAVASRRSPAPDAEALARQAEDHLVAGRRNDAIKALRRLVTRFPRSAAAQAGLIDLGRLLERSARKDQARCAYALFLERWPSHALRGDVTAAHRALGEGPRCRGLRPQR